MHASILVVGHPHPEEVQFGADFSPNYNQALKALGGVNYSVVVAARSLPKRGKVKDVLDFLKKVRDASTDVQIVLVGTDASPLELQQAINVVGIFKIISSFETSGLQLAVREALEEFELIKQNQAFLHLTQEQNQKLQHLSTLLEEKVKAREAYLIEAREKLLKATRRTEALNRSMVAIHRGLTKQDIEQALNDALHAALNLSWTRILYRDQSFLEQMDDKSSSVEIFSAPLFRDKDLLGHIYFAREKSQPFSSDEDDFLLQITDAVGLAIDRLMAIEATEALKQEWDSTFDSITNPVSLIDEDYLLIRVNKAYAEQAASSIEGVLGKKCFEVLFNRTSPCTNCVRGEEFELGDVTCRSHSVVNYSVTSHPVKLNEERKTFALFYRDISQEQKIQRQILESSKMAEIGTIGSSIAHEINNPLGGMIAFLQIIKGELDTTNKMYQDIVEMEQAAIRCKTIVENLLAFTRQSGSTEKQISPLSDLVKIVFNIIDLQARGLGIQIDKDLEDPDVKIRSDTNQLIQVLVNVMQNSCEAIAERMSGGLRQPQGKVTLKSRYQDPRHETVAIEIIDNGPGIPPQDLPRVFTPFFTTKDKTKNPGLGLSVSYQIVKEHGGQMEISSIPGKSTTVLIALPVAKSPTS